MFWYDYIINAFRSHRQSQITKELPIEEVRKMLGIKSEDLTEVLEVEDLKLREKEKRRLEWLY